MPPIIIEVTSHFIGQEGHMKAGQRLQVDEKRARYLIERGLAKLHKPAGPSETKPAGPGEVKTGDPAVKKSSGAPTTGPLTAPPSSSAPGPAAPWSSWPVAPASQPLTSSVAGALVTAVRAGAARVSRGSRRSAA